MTYDPNPKWSQNEFIKSHDGDYLPKRPVSCIYVHDSMKQSIQHNGFFGKTMSAKIKWKLIIEYSNKDSFEWEFSTREEAVEAREHLAKQLDIKL